MTNRGWFWLLFLILIIGLLATLATRFNILLILSDRKALLEPVLGTLGFIVILAGFILLFTRLTQEMRLNQLQSEFLAAITHELKTPIATLELSSSLLKQPDLLPSERDQLWKSHEIELNRLRTEVETLLEAARWDAKSVKSKKTKINLENWINQKIIEWKILLGNDAIILREGAPLPEGVYVDPKMLDLVCLNLIENARKFSIGRPHLRITSLRDGKRWSLSFQDQGFGFDPSESKKIFKRFYRARHSAPYSISGTGLGLYLAKAACKRMKIKIKADSLGHQKGATFTLSGKSLV